MKQPLIAVLPALLIAGTASAEGVAGTWKVDGSVFGYAVKPTCTFTENAGKLSGSCSGAPQDAPLSGELMNGTTVKWQYVADDKGDKHDMKFDGVIGPDNVMRGRFTADGHGGKFTATRQ